MIAGGGRAGVPRTVWLAGANGMLGRVMRREIEASGARCAATDQDLDIADEAAALAYALRERPELIINAAAYTRVDDAETHEADAFRVNATGAGALARAAREVGAVLVHFSTDYVFGGDTRSPRREDSPTDARGVYAKSKLEGEARVLSSGATAYVVRTSWLFGENGANFVRTMVGLMKDRDELRVVADQHGRPTYAADLARATLELTGLTRPSAAEPGLYHFANAGETSWHGFAVGIREACLRLGIPVRAERIVPVTTAEFPRPAPRPSYSVLDTARIEAALGKAPRPWDLALDSYLRKEFQDE